MILNELRKTIRINQGILLNEKNFSGALTPFLSLPYDPSAFPHLPQMLESFRFT